MKTETLIKNFSVGQFFCDAHKCYEDGAYMEFPAGWEGKRESFYQFCQIAIFQACCTTTQERST